VRRVCRRAGDVIGATSDNVSSSSESDSLSVDHTQTYSAHLLPLLLVVVVEEGVMRRRQTARYSQQGVKRPAGFYESATRDAPCSAQIRRRSHVALRGRGPPTHRHSQRTQPQEVWGCVSQNVDWGTTAYSVTWPSFHTNKIRLQMLHDLTGSHKFRQVSSTHADVWPITA